MSASNLFRAEIHIPFRPSRLLLWFLAVSHGCAALVPLLLPLPVYGQAFLLLTIALSAWHGWRKQQGLLPSSPLTLTWREAAGWEVTDHEQQSIAVLLENSSFTHRWLQVLNFRSPGGRRFSLILLPDNVDAEVARNLRRRLNLLH